MSDIDARSSDLFSLALSLRGTNADVACYGGWYLHYARCDKKAAAAADAGGGAILLCLDHWRALRDSLRSGGDRGSAAARGLDGEWRLVGQGWDPDEIGLPETDFEWAWDAYKVTPPGWAGSSVGHIPGRTLPRWILRLHRYIDGQRVSRTVYVEADNAADAERLGLADAEVHRRDGDPSYEVDRRRLRPVRGALSTGCPCPGQPMSAERLQDA